MSTGSFKLSKVGETWWAEGTLESGRVVKFDCGSGSKERAEGIAEQRWERKLAASNASKKRWANFAEKKHATTAATSSPTNGAPPPPPSSAASKGSPARNAELRGKLLSLGDGKPINPDAAADPDEDEDEDDDQDDDAPEKGADYIPPGAAREDEDDAPDEDEEEAAELLADLIGNGIYSGVTGGVTKFCKSMKPPKRPGDPHELFVRYGREGCCHRMRKLIGKGAKLSPNAKLLIGFGGTIITMLWNAEDIEEQPRTAAAAAAAPAAPARPAAPAAPPHANGTAPKLALVKQREQPAAAPPRPPEDDPPLGKFS